MTITKIAGIAFIFVLGVLLVVGFVSHDGPAVEPTPTATPTSIATPTPLPTVVMSCVQARDAIQLALSDYHAEHGAWPTADSQPGDIEWTKLVPDFMAGIPSNDVRCEWRVNSDPEGAVCLQNIC